MNQWKIIETTNVSFGTKLLMVQTQTTDILYIYTELKHSGFNAVTAQFVI